MNLNRNAYFSIFKPSGWLWSLLVVFLLTFNACGGGSGSSDEDSEAYEEDEEAVGYADGTYCADVEYYNPNTGTRSDYTLNVEVEDNEVTVIYWPNTGYLDDDHFSPEELDSNGECSFESDKGYEYTVSIRGSECSFTDEREFYRDRRHEEEEVTCPKCGSEKYSYDELCNQCQEREDKTCPKCGQYDPFMFSLDDQCSACEKREREREQEDD